MFFIEAKKLVNNPGQANHLLNRAVGFLTLQKKETSHAHSVQLHHFFIRFAVNLCDGASAAKNKNSHRLFAVGT
jgi:hypothetical protein